MGSLNPVLQHRRADGGGGAGCTSATWARSEALARGGAGCSAEVGICLEPETRRLSVYPHEFSGGHAASASCHRHGALLNEPRLLIADEPTTALDVTVQRQILELLARLKAERRMSMLFISHDLGVVGEIADQVVVMRQGQVRETGPVAAIFTAPQDAYTRALLACRPRLDDTARRLVVIDEHIAGETGQNTAAPVSPAVPRNAEAPVLIEARGLCKSFPIREGLFRQRAFKAVQDVSFTLRRGHTLGVVGESGSGKTTMGLDAAAAARGHGGAGAVRGP